MRLSEMINKYNLHDSMIKDIKYLYNKGKIIIYMELCNWKQKSYNESESEIILGNLVFQGVKKYEIEPEDVLFDYDEILKVEVSQVTDDDNEIIKMVLRGSDDVKLINIQASDVEWIIS